MVQRAKGVPRIAVGIEQGRHQHAHLAVRRGVADQTHGRGLALQFVSPRIGLAGCGDGDDPLVLAAVEKLLDAVPADAVDAQAEVPLRLQQRGDGDDAGKAAIEHEQIGQRLYVIERFEQHLALRSVGRMQARMQGQFGAGDIQGERLMIDVQVGAGARGYL